MEKSKYYKKIGMKLLVLLFILVACFLLYKLAIFYMPFIIAIIVSICIEPMVNFFMKRLKFNRKLACSISLLLVISILGGLIALATTKLIVECTSLITDSNDHFKQIYDSVIFFINEAQEGRTLIPQEIVELIKNSAGGIIDAAEQVAVNTGKSILSKVGSIPTMITYTIITILAIIFTCFDKQFVMNQIKSQVPTKWVNKIKEVYNEMCSVTWNYIKAEVKLSFICFIWVFASLIIVDLIGLDIGYPVLMAVIIGFVDLLPLFGAGTVMLPWAVYLMFIGNIPLAITVICIWGVWAVFKQLIEPKMVSKQIGMHPIFTLVGMYTGFKVFGVLGLMIGPIIMLIVLNAFKELLKKGILKSFFEMD